MKHVNVIKLKLVPYFSSIHILLITFASQILIGLAALGSCEVVTPVPKVEEEENKGETKSGENINFLCLELEVSHPACETSWFLQHFPLLVENSSCWHQMGSFHPPHKGVLKHSYLKITFTKALRGFPISLEPAFN